MSSELVTLSEKIKDNSIIWTSRNLEKIIRNFSYSELNGYSFKKKDDFNEVVYWLTEGFLKCNIKNYRFDIVEDLVNTEEISDILTGEELRAYLEINNTSTYPIDIQMKFQAWKILYKKGAREFEFKKRNYGIYAKDLQIFVQTGDVNITHIRDSFKKGITEYIILPYFKEKEGKMFIFQSTHEFIEYLDTKELENKEISGFFLRTKIKKPIKKDSQTDSGTQNFNLTDLIIFKEAKKSLRGIILGIITPGTKGIKFAKDIYEKEMSSHMEDYYNSQSHYEKMLNITDDRVKFRWQIQEQAYNEEMVFVKHPKRTSTAVVIGYYAVKKEDIIYKVPIDLKIIIDTVKTVFNRSNDNSLKLNFTNEKNFPSNAAYDPSEHQIIVSLENLYHLVVNRFIDEGLNIAETTEMVIAHELGHADSNSLYLFNDRFYDVIDRFNETNQWIQQTWQEILFCSATKEAAETTLEKLIELLYLAEEHKKLELQGEKDAFSNGLKYISKDFHLIFEKENYTTFLSYQNKHDTKINVIREQINHLSELLIDYEQLDFNS